jgi:hypothetical protein
MHVFVAGLTVTYLQLELFAVFLPAFAIIYLSTLEAVVQELVVSTFFVICHLESDLIATDSYVSHGQNLVQTSKNTQLVLQSISSPRGKQK